MCEAPLSTETCNSRYREQPTIKEFTRSVSCHTLVSMRRFILSLGFLLALSACSTTSPHPADQTTPTSPGQEVSKQRLDAITMLHTSQLPQGWKVVSESGQNVVSIFSQSTYTGYNDAINHGVFFAHTIAPGRCDAGYAKEQSAQDGDGTDVSRQLVIDGVKVGYTWMGFAGAGVLPGDTPNMRYLCLHHPLATMDIEISSYAKDASTLAYIDTTFIPFWLQVGVEATYRDENWGISFQLPLIQGVDPPYIFTDGGVWRTLSFGPVDVKGPLKGRRYAMTDYGAPRSLSQLEETIKLNRGFSHLKDMVPGNPPTEVTINGRTYLRWVLNQHCTEPTVTLVEEGKAVSFSMCSKGEIASEIEELQTIARGLKFLR